MINLTPSLPDMMVSLACIIGLIFCVRQIPKRSPPPKSIRMVARHNDRITRLSCLNKENGNAP